MSAEDLDSVNPAEPATGSAGFSDAVKSFIASIHAFLSGAADLLATEGRLAGLTFVRMLALSLGFGVLAITGWLCLVAAIVAWFATQALTWPTALLIAAGLNVVAAYGVWRLIFRLSANLSFQELRENLSADPRMQISSSGRENND